MNTTNKRYGKTTIDHKIRVKLGLTCDQYVFLDCIYMLNQKSKYAIQPEDIEKATGLSIEEVNGVFKSLKDNKCLHTELFTLKTTELWNINFLKEEVPMFVIAYLNSVIGSSYKPDSKAALKYIHARTKEGFTTEDFLLVIDFKANEWLMDDGMKQYLRPETLFGSKMESYLQTAKLNKPKPVVNPKMNNMIM